MASWFVQDWIRPVVFAIGAAFALAGCGGVAVEGKLLDAVGLSTSSQNAKGKEPKLASRAPLVVPPSTEQLPEPGSTAATQVAVADPSFPTNPEEAEAREKKQREAKRKEECSAEAGKYGSRQSGKHADTDDAGEKNAELECSSPIKDLFGESL
ncbi:MAG: hypothetical protein ACR2O4_11185 [Hyphomicrobiaceae bacterium]